MIVFEAMTPTIHLDRAAEAAADRIGVVDGDRRFTYGQLHDRAGRAAGGLGDRSKGAPIAVLSGNSHVMLEMHFAAPWASSPLVALNTRLSIPELEYIVAHSGAALLLYEQWYEDLARAVAAAVPGLQLVRAGGDDDQYQALIEASTPRHDHPSDEHDLIAINYTSGTTGRPKGAMYHHRGAYLQGISQVGSSRLDASSVFLWTLPMFHCNGWGYPWAVTAAGGRHVCLPRVEPALVWDLIATESVTHLNCAPTVLTMIGNADQARALSQDHPLRICTGGSPPTPTVLERMAELNIEITHLYGLTETYGPSIVCDWQPEWDALPVAERARLKARQGVRTMTITGLEVCEEDGSPVPRDATTIGELMLRGHTLMLGYLDDDQATEAAMPGGWLRTGDLAVRHPDGYVELRDRSKDVIISGGENISSVEVEQAISSHSDVLEAAVVALPDERWGEAPVAYVVARPGRSLSEADIIEHVRLRLARFKAPKAVIVVEDLPKTATGKVQKFLLRDRAGSTKI